MATPSALRRAVGDLVPGERIALDTEADGFHHYFDKICLIQIATRSALFLVDPLAQMDFAPLLRALADKTIVLHGSDYDLRLLRRAFGFVPKEILDTAAAAQLIGCEEFGLAALIEKNFGVPMPKRNQRADWSIRPLPPDMIEYGAGDVRLLLDLAEQLEAELDTLGRADWLRQTCQRLLEDASADRENEDHEPWRVRGWSKLEPKELAVLREMWQWRDKEARRLDRPAFRILGNETLIEMSRWAAANGEPIPPDFPHLPRNLHGARLEALQRAAAKGRSTPPHAWPDKRKIGRRTGARPTPQAALAADKMREARNAMAAETGLSPGLLAPNGAIAAIAARWPANADELREAGRLMPWQAGIVADKFLAILNGESLPGPTSGNPPE